MAKDTIYTLFRQSDAEQRSYSLAERLNAGKFLFKQDTDPSRKMDTWQDIFWNAVHVVFDNRILKRSYAKESLLSKDAGEPAKFLEQQQRDENLKKELTNRDSFASKMMTAGYWNPYAWLEALSLFWVNWATARYDPLKDSFTSSLGSEIHIAVATFFHAAAKTINLIATPLTVILLLSAAVIFGFTPAVIATMALGILASIYSVAYHANLSRQEYKDNRTNLYHLATGLRHLAESIIIGLTQPLIRLFERARDLYHTNPTLFWAGVFVVTIAVLAFAVFPYVGAPALLGFKLGTFAFNLLNPLLATLGEYFTLTGFQLGVFKTAVSFVVTLGVVDLITRGFKEVAGWFNVKTAKEKGETQLKQDKTIEPMVEQNKRDADLKNGVVSEIEQMLNNLKEKVENSTDSPPTTQPITDFNLETQALLNQKVAEKVITEAESKKISSYAENNTIPLRMSILGIENPANQNNSKPVFKPEKVLINPSPAAEINLERDYYAPQYHTYPEIKNTPNPDDTSALTNKLSMK